MVPLRLLAVIALFAGCIVGVAAAQAPPTGIACGDTITADTTLDRDLTDCPSNGIVIGADGITLDLNGHTISGDGKLVRRCRRDQICDVGVANDDHAGVTIRGGSVRGFGIGVGVFRGRNDRFVELDSSRNQFFGFVIGGSSRTVIRDSSGNDNPRPDGDGLGVFNSHDLRIVHNSFRRNGQLGMHIEGSTKNLVKGNLVSRNGDFGILLEADGNQLRGNRSVRDGGTGILVGPGSRNVIAGNRISGSGEGIAIEKGRGNVVVRNVVAHTRKSGIRLGIGDPPIGSTRTLVRGNLVVSAGRDGFVVAKNDRSSLLVRNTARRSGDDGFDINSPSARLIRNLALGSIDQGVERP
ncbi:MAG TPA: right-handed parallel beta-helix repeat-containing protein [Jatrophihabitantaceae bacterium]|nr:right-handed parallel beta-helix repeat-containing protein [Jatrophihabitantaceae bacterium]